MALMIQNFIFSSQELFVRNSDSSKSSVSAPVFSMYSGSARFRFFGEKTGSQKREHAIAHTVGDEHFAGLGINGHTGGMDEIAVWPFDDAARGNVAIVGDVPHADKAGFTGLPRRRQVGVGRQIFAWHFERVRRVILVVDGRDEDSAERWIDRQLPGPHNSRVRAGNYALWRDVTVVRAVEDEKTGGAAGYAGSAGGNDAIVNGIDGDADDEKQTGFRSGDDAFGRRVAVGVSIEYEKAAAAGIGHNDFVVFLVHGERVRTDKFRSWSLDRADGRLGAGGSAVERQHSCAERDRNDDFVMRGIVGQAVHGAAQMRGLAFN